MEDFLFVMLEVQGMKLAGRPSQDIRSPGHRPFVMSLTDFMKRPPCNAVDAVSEALDPD